MTTFPCSRRAGSRRRRPGALGWLLVLGLQFSILNLPAAPPAAATSLDLGQGLTYLRVRQLPEDAVALAAAWRAPALIVDLRYPAGTAAGAVPADLPARPPAAPLFVLVGPETPPAAIAALRQHAPALITLGLPAPDLTPDIALSVSPATDRRAYDALDAGASVTSLIEVKVAKERFDEAALTREHDHDLEEDGETPNDLPAAPGVPAVPATPAPAGPPAPDAKTKPASPPPLIDVTLQRAVQLHQALLALRKIPAG